MNATIDQWLKLAEGDYIAAKSLLNQDNVAHQTDELLYPAIIFHAQQCAEKLLKSVLVHCETEVPKTHEIHLLTDLVAPWITISISRVDLVFLAQGAVKTRYPGDEPTVETVRHAMKICEDIRVQVQLYFQNNQ